MLSDMSGVLKSFGLISCTVTRRASNGYDAHGRSVPSTNSTVLILAHVQPLSGRELERLPEGLRTREVRALWTESRLELPEGSTLSDLVELPDRSSWEVHAREDWSSFGNFLKYLIVKVVT